MRKLGLILLAMAVLVGFLSSQAGAQEPLKGECYLVIINQSGLTWDQVLVNGEPMGIAYDDMIFLTNFQCGGERVLAEIYYGKSAIKKELIAIKDPSDYEIPMNRFIWKLE